MSRTYQVVEVFYSLQGEGMRAGTANVFVRFTGCNLTCKLESHGFDCDSTFTGGIKYTAERLVTAMNTAWPRPLAGKAVVLTGGEPLLQVDDDLLALLRADQWFIAVETNGTVEPPAGIDWLTTSPKVAEHALRVRTAEEVKYVIHNGMALPRVHIKTAHKLVSPAWGPDALDRSTLAWCIEQVKQHPDWRLSMQQHKLWGVR